MSENQTPAAGKFASALREAFGLAGAALIGVGGWMHYPPLGLMLGGAVMVALVVLSFIVERR